jgi:hypothetical protein
MKAGGRVNISDVDKTVHLPSQYVPNMCTGTSEVSGPAFPTTSCTAVESELYTIAAIEIHNEYIFSSSLSLHRSILKKNDIYLKEI